MMMKPAEDRHRYDAAQRAEWRDGSERLFVERPMSPQLVVVGRNTSSELGQACFAQTTTGSTHSRWIDPVSLLPFCRVIRATARLANEFSNFSRDCRAFPLFGHGIGGHFPLPGGGDDLPCFFGPRLA